MLVIQQQHEVKINELKNEHKEFIAHFDQLRAFVNQGQLKDQAQLQHLAVTNEHVIKVSHFHKNDF